MTSDTHNAEMHLAWQFVAQTGVSVFLTGKAGTGKTTFLHRLRETMPKRMVVLAPTGVAAINAHGQTIHSFFQFAPGLYLPDQPVQRSKAAYKMSQTKRDLIRTLDLLVIDEVSMVRADLLDQIDNAMRQYRDRTRPFGGVQLLLIGDLMQLSPVAKSDEWDMLSKYYDTPYFFSSRALRQMHYVTVELRHIYRQQDQAFIDILAAVRSGNLSNGTIQLLNSRYIPGFRPDGRDWIRLTTHNYAANQFNDSQLQALPTPPRTFDAAVKGDFPEINFPTDRSLTLKVGAQVMFVKNDPSDQHAYYNGKIGRVIEFGENVIVVSCEGDDRPIKVTPVQWENTKYILDDKSKDIRETIVGTFAQFPLRLAWAITVHKSQGLTFDHAVLDVNQSFTHGQTYVALSRCRTLDGLVLAAPISLRSVITDRTVEDYIGQQSTAMERSARQLPDLKFQYTLNLLDELYNFNDIRRDYQWLTRVVDEHLRYQAPWLLTKLKELDEPLNTSIITVAYNFRAHYIAAMQQPNALATDAPLTVRIRKSAAYFRDQLRQVFNDLLRSLALNIQNKQTAQTYTNAVNALRHSLQIKSLIFERLSTEDFSTSAYLNAKAQATLASDAPSQQTRQQTRQQARRTKAPKPPVEKKPRPQKGDSMRETKALYDSGLTPEQIATKRGLADSTVYSHLANYVANGEIDLDSLVTPEQQQLITLTASKFDTTYTVADIQALLPPDITPGQIRLTLNYNK